MGPLGEPPSFATSLPKAECQIRQALPENPVATRPRQPQGSTSAAPETNSTLSRDSV